LEEKSMTEQAISFATIKAPGGGYQLSEITSIPGDGDAKKLQTRVIAYRTTLPEIQAIEHAMKQKVFGEVAWNPPPPQPIYPPQPPGPPRHAEPAGGDDGSLPDVVHNWHNESLMDRIGNGGARALLPMLVLAGVWLSVNVGRFA
jgi:hypothetical protein